MVSLTFKLPGADTETLVLDAAPSEDHGSSAEVTQFPVETGANVTDHVRQLPDHLRIEGVVTNTPFPSQIVGGNDATFADDMRTGAYSDRAETAFNKVRALLSGVLVTVSTELRSYDSMVLQTLSAPRSAAIGDVVRFTADFVHVVMVSTQTVQLARSPKPAKVKTGTQPKKEVGKDDRPSSALRTLAGGDSTVESAEKVITKSLLGSAR
jgi:hypothetical protein